MKRRILLVVAVFLILIGIFILVRVVAGIIAPRGRGALQITSSVKAQVFLDGKTIGETPLCKCDQNQTIKEGTYEIKIVPEDKSLSPFMARVKINSGVLTAVDRTFLPGSLASSYILTLEKTNSQDAELFIATIPDGAQVLIDGDPSGLTPLTIKPISASEHEIQIQKQGFSKKTVRVRAVSGFKLVLNAVLGTRLDQEESVLSPEPTLSVAPTESKTKQEIKIRQTPNGFLRVRENPTTSSRELTRVTSGETFSYSEEQNGWYKINLPDGTSGWISGAYAEKI